MKRERVLLHTWAPLLLWIAIVVLESTFGSSVNTGALLKLLTGSFSEGMDSTQFETVHFLIRKGGHVVGFGILGYLWFRTLLRVRNDSAPLTSAALAVACSLLIAALDEWHQGFLSDRTGSVDDVALDTLAAIVLISLAIVSIPRSSSHTEKLPDKPFAVEGEVVIDFHTTDAFMKKLREQAAIAGSSLNAFIQHTLEKQLPEEAQKAAPEALARHELDDETIKAFLKALEDHDREERRQQKADLTKPHAQENENREKFMMHFAGGALPEQKHEATSVGSWAC